jgi:hypothetical protein
MVFVNGIKDNITESKSISAFRESVKSWKLLTICEFIGHWLSATRGIKMRNCRIIHRHKHAASLSQHREATFLIVNCTLYEDKWQSFVFMIAGI